MFVIIYQKKTLKTIHEVLACYKLNRNFSFERSYISRLAGLVRPMSKKQSLLTIVFIRFIQHFTS